ncbi:MAG: tyrosine-type recombinase/integrase [Burkholderiaceae bacterium]|nr:tyrosine-type recombinase/integrase [Burkholderiaceae bacterium]
MTAQSNPCSGIKGYRETGRETAPGDALVQRVLEVADKPLELAMRLAELTGQRPADVLRMNEASIRDGVLHVKQGKTEAKLRIVIEGELAALLEEIHAYKASVKITSTALLVNEKGQPLTKGMRHTRFNDARERAGVDKALFQFRDLRAKTATEADEAGGTRTAQAILGHTTEAMTAAYIRHRAGKKVRPIR